MEELKDKLIGRQNTIRAMNPKHYKLQSEYHRLMYAYTLELELIQKTLGKTE